MFDARVFAMPRSGVATSSWVSSWSSAASFASAGIGCGAGWREVELEQSVRRPNQVVSGVAADLSDPAIERALQISFLPGSIYLISRMPSDPQADDIVPIVVVSLLLAFIATLYPSWRASRVQPAEALRYE
jgi:ABC-type antimicrobial peptide transport system permease subunit